MTTKPGVCVDIPTVIEKAKRDRARDTTRETILIGAREIMRSEPCTLMAALYDTVKTRLPDWSGFRIVRSEHLDDGYRVTVERVE